MRTEAMSKYNSLWEYVQKNGSNSFKLTFEEIQNIAGIPIDYSFLKYKKELTQYGYQVGEISMQEQTILFNKIDSFSFPIINFYEKIDDPLMKFAVIISKTEGKYVFCKHKDRDTLEVPGGHREQGEAVLDTAKRELYEETGAIDYDIKPICAYSVIAKDNFEGEESFGMLYYADIKSFEGGIT